MRKVLQKHLIVWQVFFFAFVALFAASAVECHAEGKGAAHEIAKHLHGVWFGKEGYGYIRDDGSVAIEPQFEQASYFQSNGLAVVKKNGLWGYVKSDGSFAIQPQRLGNCKEKWFVWIYQE